VVEIVKESAVIAEILIEKSLETDLIGLKADDLVEYVHMISDNLVTQLGLNPIFRDSNPFEWMVAIGIPNRTNFFEQRVPEYLKLGSQSTLEFDTTAEF
jgi:ribonucleotide reductase beta subunit family protein with ferritin-like domain